MANFMRLIILLLILVINILLPTACPRTTEQPLPNEATVLYASNIDTEIYVSNYDGMVYGYDWETLVLTSQLFIGEDIRMTFDESGTHLYVISSDKGTLSMVNTRTNALEKTVTLNTTPTDVVCLSGLNKICVTLQPQSAIQVLSAYNLSVITTFQLGGFPYHLVSSPDGSVIYTNISSELDKSPTSLVAIDSQDGTILNTIEMAKGSYELAVPQHGRHIYIPYKLH